MTSPRSLAAFCLDAAPLSDPLCYPGSIPGESGLLVDGSYLELRSAPGCVLGRWRVESSAGAMSLDEALEAVGVAPTERRTAVLAVGSNAAPAQLSRKFDRHDVPFVVPMVRVRVTGLAAGVSAHVSHGRYVPSTPVVSPGEVSEMFVLWLDEMQLAALDATEPNYRRTPLRERFPERVPSGQLVRDCSVYVSRWGCLTDSGGALRRAGDQRLLLADLLAESVELRRLCGDTPEDFVEAARDAAVRDRARHLFATRGYAGTG